MATLNEVLEYKGKFNKKPNLYKRKNLINVYKELADPYLKNDPMLLLTRPNNIYKRGNYKEYVKIVHQMLQNKKNQKGFFLNIPEPKPPAPVPSPVPVTIKESTKVSSANALTNRVSGDSYTAVGKLKKADVNLIDVYKTIKIVPGINKVFLRDAGNKFAVIARKDANEEEEPKKIDQKRLRLDLFTTLNGKNATLQFFASGAVVITGRGDKTDLEAVLKKVPAVAKADIVRWSGTMYSLYRIPYGNVPEFLKLCLSKKYVASYERELANYIDVKIEMNETGKFKHHLKFYYNGQIGYSTADLTECRKLTKELMKDAIKKKIATAVKLDWIKNSPVKKNKKEKTTCKNPPTPATFEGDCAPGYYCRPNAQGFPCCYKIPENLTVGRRTAIAAYKQFGIPMPEKVKKLLHIVVNVNVKEGNKKNNITWNNAKGVMIRKRACMRYSVKELTEFAKKLGIDLVKEKKKREGQRKKLPEGGWKKWLCDEMAGKLARNRIVEERVSGSGSSSSRVSYRVKSSNKPIIIEKNNRTHKLTILPGPPITVRGFVRLDKRRKEAEITQRRCDTLDRDTLEKIARRLGINGKQFKSKAALCQEIYNKRKNIRNNVPANSAPFKILKAKPDGNCFYEAFLRALTGGKVDPSAKQINALRKKVQTYYTIKYGQLPNNYVVDTTIGGKALTKKNFLEYVLKNGSWAGQAEIKAVSRTMKTNIIVMTPQFKVDSRFTQKNAGNTMTVYILYNGVNHFDTLIPKGTLPRVSLQTRGSSGPRRPSVAPLPNVVGGNLFGSSSSANTANLAAEMEAAMLQGRSSSSKKSYMSWGYAN